MIAGIQYNYNIDNRFEKTFFVAGGWETHKVYLDMGCFKSQSVYPVVVWKIKRKNFISKVFAFVKKFFDK